jgi:phytanoyl-CoA hydroxylase
LTVWIPLLRVTQQSGCLAVIPGSQQYGLLDMEVDEYDLKHVADPDTAAQSGIPIPLEPGDALVFNDLTLHRSLDNVSDYVRWSVDIRYCQANEAHRRKAAGGFCCFSGSQHGREESFDEWRSKWDPKTGVMRRQLRMLDLYARSLGEQGRDIGTY